MAIDSLCQASEVNYCVFTLSLIHFCRVKSVYLKQTQNKNIFCLYEFSFQIISKHLTLKIAFSKQLSPLDADESFGNAPG